jgi:hypothetical protein
MKTYGRMDVCIHFVLTPALVGEAGWDPEPVWTPYGEVKMLDPTGTRIPTTE